MHTIIGIIPELDAKPDVASSIEARIKVVIKVSKKTITDDIKSDFPTPIGIRLILNVFSHCGHVNVPR